MFPMEDTLYGVTDLHSCQQRWKATLSIRRAVIALGIYNWHSRAALSIIPGEGLFPFPHYDYEKAPGARCWRWAGLANGT